MTTHNGTSMPKLNGAQQAGLDVAAYLAEHGVAVRIV